MRLLAAGAAALLALLGVVAQTEGPKKQPTPEMVKVCKASVEQACGKLPGTDDFVAEPDAATGTDTDKICSEECKATMEGVNCRGTEFSDIAGEYGPTGAACSALSCFRAFEGPCGITQQRSDAWGVPIPSCTTSCMASLNQPACSGANDLTEAINENCSFQHCNSLVEPSCGELDFLDEFGVDLTSPDIHPWLLQRAEQLCSAECRGAWDSMLSSKKGQCIRFGQLEEARLYLDEIVCGCYLPAKIGCGEGALLGRPVSSDMPLCCVALSALPCELEGDLSFYEDEYSSFYGPNGGSYDRGAAAEYEKQDAEGQEEEDTRVVHVFDFGDPIAERIAQLQKCCDVDLLPTDKGSCFPSGPLQGVSGTEHDTANSFGVLSVGPMTRLIFGAIFLARALLTSIT